jgi:gliding motility-associated-like protein
MKSLLLIFTSLMFCFTIQGQNPCISGCGSSAKIETFEAFLFGAFPKNPGVTNQWANAAGTPIIQESGCTNSQKSILLNFGIRGTPADAISITGGGFIPFIMRSGVTYCLSFCGKASQTDAVLGANGDGALLKTITGFTTSWQNFNIEITPTSDIITFDLTNISPVPIVAGATISLDNLAINVKTQGDNIPPIIICPKNLQLTCAQNANDFSLTGRATATDNIDPSPVISLGVDQISTQGCTVTLRRTWIATDACGNKSTCVQIITTIDDQVPVITCPPNRTINCKDNFQFTIPTAVDNCDNSVAITNNFTGTLPLPTGMTSVVYTATDNCGNTATCTVKITVICDNIVPDFCGNMVATCESRSGADVAVLFETKYNSGAIPGHDWNDVSLGTNRVVGIHPAMWKRQFIGQVFGIALDDLGGRVYFSATDVYRKDNGGFGIMASGPGGRAGIYLTNVATINTTTTLVQTLNAETGYTVGTNRIPNTGVDVGNGIGNIAYDEAHNQIFATNLGDGRIYRIDATTGLVKSIFDPFALDAGGVGIAPNGEAIWGIGFYNNTVYFARSVSATAKEIWSVKLNSSGEFIATSTGGTTPLLFKDVSNAVLNIPSSLIPGNQQKITDIAFSSDGNSMSIAERGNPHSAKVFEYKLVGTTWSTADNFYVGGFSGANSAGGVDYGEKERNKVINFECDEKLWASGNYMPTSFGPLVYGIEGMSASGNTSPPGNKSTDLYIDLDGGYTIGVKGGIGDVELFHCGCPTSNGITCDSLMVTSKPTPVINIQGNKDKCCYDISLKNKWGADIVGVQATMLTPGWNFNTVSLSSPYVLGSCPALSNKFCFRKSGGGAISSTTHKALSFCFAQTTASAANIQYVEFSWIQQVGKDSIIVCRDTLLFNCKSTANDSCITVNNAKIDCYENGDPNKYKLCFTITNNTGQAISYITLENLPAGFSFGPLGSASKILYPLPNPLPNGATSSVMCVEILASLPVTVTQNLCFKIGAVNDKGNECCHAPKEVCVPIKPCCDPCEKNGVIAHAIATKQGECCYSVDLINECNNRYFAKVEMEILTPGVTIGSHVINPSFASSFTVSSSPTNLMLIPVGGALSLTTYNNLFQFCLDELKNPSQNNPVMVIRWYTVGPNGSLTVACADTIKSDCKAPVSNQCLLITKPSIVCLPGLNMYAYTFTLTNTSSPAFTADKLHLIVKNDPTGYEVFPTGPIIPLTPPLASGSSVTMTINLAGTPFPAPYPYFVFQYRLQNSVTGDCCFESKCDSIAVPPCKDPCGFICDKIQKEFGAEQNQAGTLLNNQQVGFYPVSGKPTVVNDGCNSSSKSISLFGITKLNTSGDAAGVRSNGVAGPDTLFKKGKTYCIKFCTKYSHGLGISTANLEVSAGGISPAVVIQNYILNVPSVWVEKQFYYTPSTDQSVLIFRNNTISPLDGPPTILIDDVRISSTVAIANDNVPPVISCPKDITVTSANKNCTYLYTLPAVTATDNVGVQTITCYLGSTVLTPGANITLPGNASTQIICIAEDWCGNKDTCSFAITVLCSQKTCTCGTFSEMTYRPYQGLQSQPISCGDTLVAQCKGPINWTLGGNFMCAGNDCPAVVPMNYTLTNSSGTVVSTGSMSGPSFSLSILGTTFSTTGVYNLSLSAVCGKDTCKCNFKINVICPPDLCCNKTQAQLDADFIKYIKPTSFPNCGVCFEFNGYVAGACTSIGISIDGTPPVSPKNNIFCYNNLSNGVHDICFIMEAYDKNGIVCYRRDTCIKVTINCCQLGGDPCAKTDISMNAQQNNKCCYDVTIKNDFCDKYFKGIVVQTVSPTAISQVIAINGWTICHINSNTATLCPPSGTIPLGTQNIFTICNELNPNPIEVSISWLAPNSQGTCDTICKQTFKKAPCDKSGCVSVVKDSVDCKNKKYCFKIKNNTTPSFVVSSVDIINISPAGATLTPSVISIPPLAFGSTSGWICVDYAGASSGNKVCFQLVAHKEDVSTGTKPTTCCTDTTKHCFIVPQCPPDTTSCCNYTIAGLDNILAGALSTIVSDGCKICVTPHGGFCLNLSFTIDGVKYSAADKDTCIANLPNGSHTVCALLVVRDPMTNNICYQKELCKSIIINCGNPCGYLCDKSIYQFGAEQNQVGTLLNNLQTGFYPVLGKPEVVNEGCNGSTKSIKLNGITKININGEAAGVHSGGVAGPDTIFRKGKTYCIKFCTKYAPGLAISTANLEVSASGVTPKVIIQNYVLNTPNVWVEKQFFYTPTSDHSELVFRNSTISPLDVPPSILIDDVRIASTTPVYNDLTPPVLTNCPSNITVSGSGFPCVFSYTIPTITATDNVAVDSLYCKLDGVIVATGTSHNLNSGVHNLVCTAKDVCGNVTTCKTTITVTCPQGNVCCDTSKVTLNNYLNSFAVVSNNTNCSVCVDYKNDKCTYAQITYADGVKHTFNPSQSGKQCYNSTGTGAHSGNVKIKVFRLDTNGDTCMMVMKTLTYQLNCKPIGICCDTSKVTLNNYLNSFAVVSNNANCSVCVDYKNDKCTYAQITYADGVKHTFNPSQSGKQCYNSTGTGAHSGSVKIKVFRLDTNGDTCMMVMKNLTYQLNCTQVSTCCNISKDSLASTLNRVEKGKAITDCQLCLPLVADPCGKYTIKWGDGKDTLVTNTTTVCHKYKASGNYNVTIRVERIDAVGNVCVFAERSFTITIVQCAVANLCDPNTIVIYNALSPNNDGLNDVLIIDNGAYCGQLDITIYNRWGQIVWQERDYKNTWSGKSIKGEELPDGTYYLVLGLPDLDIRNRRLHTYIDLRRDK